MKKISRSKILTTILVLSLILSAALPTGIVSKAVTQNVVKEPDYSTSLVGSGTNFTALEADGWVASYSQDPQNGVPFTDLASIGKEFESYKADDGTAGTIRQNNGRALRDYYDVNPFFRMAALTYTKQTFKYFTLNLEFAFKADSTAGTNACPWPIITFNQPKTTPEMFYAADITGSNVSTLTGGDDAIAAIAEYSGNLDIRGKKANGSQAISSELGNKYNFHKIELTVTPGKVYMAVYNTDGTIANKITTKLDESYVGGYIALMLNSRRTFIRNFSITELECNFGDYSTSLTDVTAMDADGWVASYSEAPQSGKPFVYQSSKGTISKISDLFEVHGNPAGIIRRAQSGIVYGVRDSGTPFNHMGALTYTKQKYKYFTLTAEYKFNTNTAPWPIITFNQPNTTPEMFYASGLYGSTITNPTGGDSAIGAVVHYEGNLRIYGKKATASANNASAFNDTAFHKVQLTVTPGQIYMAVYNTDGTVAKEITTPLDASYEGGYIALMLNSKNTHFRNFAITALPEVEINNYYATPDGNGGIANDKLLIERELYEVVKYSDILPERAGYSFMGFYSDSEYNNKIALNSKIDATATVYAKWSEFGDVTANGVIDIRDLVRIYKMSEGSIDKSSAADLDFDGMNASISDLQILRSKLLGIAISGNSASAAKLMNEGLLYPLGRTMVLDGAVEMDHVNTGFVFKGNFEGDVKADFSANRVGSLLNVSVDGGENKVIELSLDGLTTLAEDLEKGEHTIEVISGTSMRYSSDPDDPTLGRLYNGTLKLNKLYYTGTPIAYDSNKPRILFFGDSITCGMGLDTGNENGYKSSNSYYSYASVLGRELGAEIEAVARCGAKTSHFAYPYDNNSGKGACDGVNWLTSINLIDKDNKYDVANNQPNLIVINLGTNDIPNSKDEEAAINPTSDYYKQYVADLLKGVHHYYPNAKIVWTVGMMSTGSDIYNEYVQHFKENVNAWSVENGNIAEFLDLSDVSNRDGYAGHPTIDGHKAAAEKLEEFIVTNNLLGDLS